MDKQLKKKAIEATFESEMGNGNKGRDGHQRWIRYIHYEIQSHKDFKKAKEIFERALKSLQAGE